MQNLRLDKSLLGRTLDTGLVIEQYLGAGGMGTTYIAFQPELQRRVCVKFLHPHFAADVQAFQRFAREAQVLSQLRHPAIVCCYYFAVAENVYPYFAMEYIDGVPLRSLIGHEDLDWKRAIQIAIDVCDALEHAHQRSFVHRDIKPDNILIVNTSGKETIKLIDFGLVAIVADRGDLTRSGEICGSLAYMAPETYRGNREANGPAIDIYALACTLFESIEGVPPFLGTDRVETMRKHYLESLPPLSIGKLPPEPAARLHAVLTKALAPDPEERFRSITEFRDELEFCKSEIKAPNAAYERPPVAKRKTILTAPTAVVLAVAALFVITAAVAVFDSSMCGQILRAQYHVVRHLGFDTPIDSGSLQQLIEESPLEAHAYLQEIRSLKGSTYQNASLIQLTALADELSRQGLPDAADQYLLEATNLLLQRSSGTPEWAVQRDLDRIASTVATCGRRVIAKIGSSSRKADPVSTELITKLRALTETPACRALPLEQKQNLDGMMMDLLSSQGDFSAAYQVLQQQKKFRELDDLKTSIRANGQHRLTPGDVYSARRNTAVALNMLAKSTGQSPPEAPETDLLSESNYKGSNEQVIKDFVAATFRDDSIDRDLYIRVLFAFSKYCRIDKDTRSLQFGIERIRPWLPAFIHRPADGNYFDEFISDASQTKYVDRDEPNLTTIATSLSRFDNLLQVKMLWDLEYQSRNVDALKLLAVKIRTLSPDDKDLARRFVAARMFDDAANCCKTLLQKADASGEPTQWIDAQRTFISVLTEKAVLSPEDRKALRSMLASEKLQAMLIRHDLKTLQCIDALTLDIVSLAFIVGKTNGPEREELLSETHFLFHWLVQNYEPHAGTLQQKPLLRFAAWYWLLYTVRSGINTQAEANDILKLARIMVFEPRKSNLAEVGALNASVAQFVGLATINQMLEPFYPRLRDLSLDEQFSVINRLRHDGTRDWQDICFGFAGAAFSQGRFNDRWILLKYLLENCSESFISVRRVRERAIAFKLMLGETAEAGKLISQCLTKRKAGPEQEYKRVVCLQADYLRTLGRAAEAAKIHKQLADFFTAPAPNDFNQLACLTAYANDLHSMDQDNEALQTANLVIAKLSSRPPQPFPILNVRLLRASCLAKLGRLDEAEQEYSMADIDTAKWLPYGRMMLTQAIRDFNSTHHRTMALPKDASQCPRIPVFIYDMYW